MILPKARYDWMDLRLQDSKLVSDYNFTLFKMCSKLLLCGEKITNEDMIEKKVSTFYVSNMLFSSNIEKEILKVL